MYLMVLHTADTPVILYSVIQAYAIVMQHAAVFVQLFNDREERGEDPVHVTLRLRLYGAIVLHWIAEKVFLFLCPFPVGQCLQ